MTVTAAGVSMWLDALAGSHDRLCDLVGELFDAGLRERSYCDGWTIVQVLSHVGSGAEIMRADVDAAMGDAPPPSPDAFPDIWARWDTLVPESARDEALAAAGGFVERLEQLGDAIDGSEFTLFGHVRTDAVDLLPARLSEHALHTWDIEVARGAGSSSARRFRRRRAAGGGIAAGARRAREARARRMVAPARRARGHIRPGPAVTPRRRRGLHLAVAEVASLTEARAGTSAQHTLGLPAEAFLRLVYGRLDPSHAPAAAPEKRATLDELRRVFPGS